MAIKVLSGGLACGRAWRVYCLMIPRLKADKIEGAAR
jgi:hypothetical protein